MNTSSIFCMDAKNGIAANTEVMEDESNLFIEQPVIPPTPTHIPSAPFNPSSNPAIQQYIPQYPSYIPSNTPTTIVGETLDYDTIDFNDNTTIINNGANVSQYPTQPQYIPANTIESKNKNAKKFNIDQYILTSISLLLISENKNISIKTKLKAHKFINMLNTDDYKDAPDIYWRAMLLKSLSNVIQHERITDLYYLSNRLYEDQIFREIYKTGFFDIILNNQDFYINGHILSRLLSNNAVLAIDDYLSNIIKYAIVWDKANTIIKQITDIMVSDGLKVRVPLNDFEKTLEETLSEIKKNKKVESYEAKDFSSSDGSLTELIYTTHDTRSKPQNKIKTALKGLNELLNGGFECGRLYVSFARSGDWKSGFMLSTALWAIDGRINSCVPNDPTAIPSVLFISHENDHMETIERIMSYYVGSHNDIQDYDKNEIATSIVNYMTSVSIAGKKVNFIFKFRPSNTIDTRDVRALIDDENEKRNEVVMLVLDYLKHLLPYTKATERHVSLGNVTLELETIAKDYNIPVITGNQLKRDAYDIIYNNILKGDLDSLKKINQSHVSESINVYENASCVLFINRVKDEFNNLYFAVKLSKYRGKRNSTTDYIAYKFVTNSTPDKNGNLTINEMRLEEDYLSNEYYGLDSLNEKIKTMMPYYDPNSNDSIESNTPPKQQNSTISSIKNGLIRQQKNPISPSEIDKQNHNMPIKSNGNGNVIDLDLHINV